MADLAGVEPRLSGLCEAWAQRRTGGPRGPASQPADIGHPGHKNVYVNVFVNVYVNV